MGLRSGETCLAVDGAGDEDGWELLFPVACDLCHLIAAVRFEQLSGFNLRRHWSGWYEEKDEEREQDHIGKHIHVQNVFSSVEEEAENVAPIL